MLFKREFTGLAAERMAVAESRPRPSLCAECPLHPLSPGFNPLFGGAYIPPLGEGSLLVIGTTGGEEEELRGEPLCGPSGRKLQRSLAWGGGRGSPLPFERWNLVNCRCTKPGRGRGDRVINRNPPTMAEIRACTLRYLYPALAKTQAKCILLLGTDVYKAVMGDRFGTFRKAMGHRLVVPRAEITPAGLGSSIITFGQLRKSGGRRRRTP